MGQFEWQQEDETWDESRSQPAAEPAKSRRRLVIAAVLVAALLAAGAVLTWQVKRRMQAAETAVQTDILAAYNLAQTAAAERDAELLLSVLSGRLPSWTSSEQEALAAGVLYDRRPWGLTAVPAASRLTLADLDDGAALDLDPDLNEAELHFPLTYQVTTAPGVTETVVLSHTAVFRRGLRNWLLSPPSSEFWGGWVTNEGRRLTLIYPERDAALAEKLAPALEELLDAVCRDETLPDCPPDVTYALRLDTHPESLALGADAQNYFSERPYLTLPAPSLLGLPVDEAGEAALLRAYGAPLVTAVLADLTEWECCRHAAVFQALADYELDKLGLRPWPVTTADHTRALQESIGLEDLEALWEQSSFPADPADVWMLYAALDFLMDRYPKLTPAELLRGINSQIYSSWLRDALNRTGYQSGSRIMSLEMLSSEWWHYAYTQTLLAQNNEPSPLPLPEQDVLLLCMSDENYDASTTMSLVRFEQQAETWQELWTGNGFLLVNPLLNDDGVILQSFAFEGTEDWQTEIWQFDGERTMLSSEAYLSVSLGQFDPTGRYAVIFVSEEESVGPRPGLIDLASCSEDACDIAPLPGLPYWSPDGTETVVADMDIVKNGGFLRNGNMIVMDASQRPSPVDLWLGDETGQLSDPPEPPVAQGYSPFWVDEGTVGYVRPQEDGEAAVVLQPLDGGEARTVVTRADILAEAGAEVGGPDAIRYVITHPAVPDLLVVAALDVLGQELFVFTYDLESGALDLRLQSLVHPFHSLGFSPDGRWLVLTGQEKSQRGETSTLYVHHIETGETLTYTYKSDGFALTPLYDWSADGEWLLFLVDDQVLSMAAPAYAYQRVLAYGQGSCTTMAWVNDED